MSHRLLEELTLNAWPPLQTLLFDGWVLAFSNGYTRRANSIHPLYTSAIAYEEKIATCQTVYAARGQETVFKITSAPEDAALDAVLDRLGYALVATTSVQTARLTAASVQGGPPGAGEHSITLVADLEPAWLEAFNRLSVTPERFQPTMAALLRQIVPPHVFAAIAVDGVTAALGLAVAERGHVGIFDIIVDSRLRNQGLGRRIVSRLLEWGQTQGAHTAYLAVMRDNAPAMHLYARLGLRETYHYWYRVAAT